MKLFDLGFERGQVVGFSDLCYGKVMVVYTRPQPRKEEESERPRGEGGKSKFIDLRFERGQIVGFGKGRRSWDVP